MNSNLINELLLTWLNHFHFIRGITSLTIDYFYRSELLPVELARRLLTFMISSPSLTPSFWAGEASCTPAINIPVWFPPAILNPAPPPSLLYIMYLVSPLIKQIRKILCHSTYQNRSTLKTVHGTMDNNYDIYIIIRVWLLIKCISLFYFMTLEQGYEFGDEVRAKVYRLQAFKFQPRWFVTIDNE